MVNGNNYWILVQILHFYSSEVRVSGLIYTVCIRNSLYAVVNISYKNMKIFQLVIIIMDCSDIIFT